MRVIELRLRETSYCINTKPTFFQDGGFCEAGMNSKTETYAFQGHPYNYRSKKWFLDFAMETELKRCEKKFNFYCIKNFFFIKFFFCLRMGIQVFRIV